VARLCPDPVRELKHSPGLLAVAEGQNKGKRK